MDRSSHRTAAAALALLLAAAPAAALAPADRDAQQAGNTGSGWLTVLAGWLGDLIGEPGRSGPRPASRPVDDDATPDNGPPTDDGEPPAGAETDSGPDYDPDG